MIYRQEPKLSSGTHVGSRLVFDDAGHLFVTQGENNKRPTAQDLDKLQGKLVRLNPTAACRRTIRLSGARTHGRRSGRYGHRNMQGAALNPWTASTVDDRTRPVGGDEINIPQAGRNYGWPIITYGINYNGETIPEAVGTAAEGMEQPAALLEGVAGLSGMAFYTSDVRLERQSVHRCAGQDQLIRLELDGDRIVREERLLGERGERIRDVRQGPDGLLYLLTDAANGKLLRVEPPRR